MRYRFKCKGKVDNGDDCPEYVSARGSDRIHGMHAEFDFGSASADLGDSGDPDEYTCTCARGHTNEYYREEAED